MNDSVIVAVSRGTGNPNRSTRAIHHPSLDRKQGRKATFLSVGKSSLCETDGNITPGLLIHLQESQVPIVKDQTASKERLASANGSFREPWTGTIVRRAGMGRSSTVGLL